MKRLPVMFAALCLAACTDFPVMDSYPPELLPRPAEAGKFPPEAEARKETEEISAELAEDAEAARGLHGLERREEPPEEDDPALAEAFFPEETPEEEEPPVPYLLPQFSGAENLAALPEAVPQEPLPPPPPPPEPAAPAPVPEPAAVLPEPEPVPEPPPPLAREPERPVPPPPPPRRPAPPPVPDFIRPSEPLPPPEKESERPFAAIPDLPAQPRSLVPETAVPSRTVTAFTGQHIEIPFRGQGWAYLGELGSRRGVAFDSRRIDNGGMSFVFRAGEEGTYLLKFNRQDFIRDQTVNDYVQVIVQPPPEVTGSAWNSATVMPDRVYAPLPPPENVRQSAVAAAGAAAVPAAAAASAPQTEQPVQTAKATPDAVPPPAAAEIPAAVSTREEAAPDTAESYLDKAQEAYDAGRIPDALDMLGRFAAAYPGGSDEAYWLYGQALEANSPSRDVKRALDYYRRLVREYPHSGRYDAARRRIAYLQRFYFDIQ